ncbi:hypothetical protein E1A91_A07G052600v1 [Gossypium mustelinum]|uniref:Uncharacterized protein n=1 Tax=Gossypium mustelinum TaxID=34275 RepID=A0A5D2YGG8_GOSMU|nr:hypothetical protein E1A91_A07G052600v1 [Gossypium mustelinum]
MARFEGDKHRQVIEAKGRSCLSSGFLLYFFFFSYIFFLLCFKG